MMTPPAMVSFGVRMMQWSPRRTATGESRTIWAQAFSPPAEFGCIEQTHAGFGLGGCAEEGDPSAIGERVGEDGRGPEADIKRVRQCDSPGWSKHHAPAQFAGVDAAEVDGGAGAGFEAGDFRLMALEATNAGADAARLEFDLLADFERAIEQGAGDDDAEALDGEGPVDGQPRAAQVALGGCLLERCIDRAQQVVKAVARRCRDANDWG